MDLLPFEDYSLDTNLTTEEILERLSRYVDHKKSFSLQYLFTVNEKPYEGTITANNFRIKRLIPYTNTFLPIIIGSVITKHGGTEIKIKMRMMMGVLVLISVWCLVAILLACFSIIAMIHLQTFRTSIILPLIMITVTYFIATKSFKRESDVSKAFFEQLFETEITGL